VLVGSSSSHNAVGRETAGTVTEVFDVKGEREEAQRLWQYATKSLIVVAISGQP
jgi:hypothetical protein